jgi:adenylate cyclase
MLKKKRIMAALKHNLADNLVNQKLGSDSAFSIGSEIKNNSVIFSDIFAFNYYLIKQSLEEVVSNLREYFTEIVDVIFRFGGMVDKFVGDEIMAEFGIPKAMSDHAERACLAALEMVRANDRLRERWKQKGKEAFHIKIGINTGEMFIGYIGSKQLLDFTAIGESVDLGLRMKDINKIYRTANNIIISEFTKNELSENLVTRELDTIRVKGTSKPVTVFELVCEKDIVVYPGEFLAHYNGGLVYYKKQEWDEAIREFKKALVLYENDLIMMYIKRCEHFKKYPPGSDWDGVFILRTK